MTDLDSHRLELTAKFEEYLGNDHVYFQPPDSIQMEYPAIVYQRDNQSRKAADNVVYGWMQRYQVTYIDRLPDSPVIKKLTEHRYSAFDRHFTTSGLNHDVFVIYH